MREETNMTINSIRLPGVLLAGSALAVGALALPTTASAEDIVLRMAAQLGELADVLGFPLD